MANRREKQGSGRKVAKTPAREARPAADERAASPSAEKASGTSKAHGVAQAKPLVGIVYGSSSDEPVMRECADLLAGFGIPFEMSMLSAHRMPDATAAYARGARRRGLRVLIGGAGMAAHLPGTIAAFTTLPVIGVPLCGSALEGEDALLSMVQMPAGVPVATLAIGKAGAKNAAILAVQILALGDAALARKLDELKTRLERGLKV
ncbi:MAG: 5-(carboxyamino)imidazole ribonucleotide mutase [Candidatus Eisenbacteria bacterium]|nr:5-(carboxyamino)imidazole ribonucleotide mutase [Candidatus Eisenbacteria bacterium]